MSEERRLQILNNDNEPQINDCDDYPLPFERSGSTSLVMILLSKCVHSNFIDKDCYIGNVGDSRALISTDGGLRTYWLSKDHRPDIESERVRILKAGG